MKANTKKLVAATATVALAAILIPNKSYAALPVIDVGSITQLSSMLSQAKEMYNQGQQILSAGMQHVALAQRAAQMIQHPTRMDWRAVGTRIQQNVTPDDTGTLAGWSQALNGAGDAYHSFASATQGIVANPAYSDAAVAHGSVGATVASADIADGAILTAMRTVGAARGNYAANNSAITAVERLATSTVGADNTQQASLNVISGAAVQNLRMQQSNQALLVSLAESNIPVTKMWRDEAVNSLNSATRRQKALSESAYFPGNMADAFKNQ